MQEEGGKGGNHGIDYRGYHHWSYVQVRPLISYWKRELNTLCWPAACSYEICQIQLFCSWLKTLILGKCLLSWSVEKHLRKVSTSRIGRHCHICLPGGKKYNSSMDEVVFERHSGFFRSSSGLNLWCCCHGEIISMVPKWLTESRLKSRKYIANNSSFLCIQGNSWMASGKWLDLNCITCVKHWCRKYFQYAVICASDLKNILLWKRDQGTFCSWIQIGSKMMYSQVPVKPLCSNLSGPHGKECC